MMILLRVYWLFIPYFLSQYVFAFGGIPINDEAIVDECSIRYQLGNRILLPACLDLNCDALAEPLHCDETKNYYSNMLHLSSRGIEAKSQMKTDQHALFNPISRLVNGKKYTKHGYKDVQILDSRSIITGKNSTEVSEWDPISDIIGQGETKYYQFNVNTTSTGFSQYYNILIFLSGNICTLPDNVGNDNQLFVYYSFSDAIFSDNQSNSNAPAIFSNGYFEALAKYDIQDEKEHTKRDNSNSDQQTLYIKVSAPLTSKKKDIWNYEFGISQNDLIYQWDQDEWIVNVDSDANSALFVSGNFSKVDSMKIENASNQSNSTHNYELYVYPGESNDTYFKGLSHSWCAVKNGPAALKSVDNMVTSLTNRSNALRQQFYLSNLNHSSNYVSFAVYNSEQGGTVFKSGTFKTMSTNACKILYNLDFCQNVAYAAPNIQVDDVSSYYDNFSRLIFQNFSNVLDQVPCDIELDALYSPLKTCEDCRRSYRDWLCAVTIPRCTTNKQSMYEFRNINDSRLLFIYNYLPYYEILPCYNQCEAIVRDCPAQLGFSCPNNGTTLNNDYYWDTGSTDYMLCNFVGNITAVSWGLRRIILNNNVLLISLFIAIVFIC